MKIYNQNIEKEINLEEILKNNTINLKLKKIIEIYSIEKRKYHNFTHIINMLKNINFYSEELIVAIIFHDIVYKINSDKNEKESVEMFKKYYKGSKQEFSDSVEKAIMATNGSYSGKGKIEKEILRVDRMILYSNNIDELLKWEEGIFKEYQTNSVNEYRKKRMEFLENAYIEPKNEKLLVLKEIIAAKKYKIGFYPGSFNPFHIGHYNILLKAESVFDKVIIGIGRNFDKIKNEKYQLPEKLLSREIIKYDGVITTVIEELAEQGEVFVVRGLRNEYDLQYEENLRNSIKDFLPEQNFTYFFCDKEFEHISSSLIRDISSRKDKNGEKFIKKYCL